MVLANYKSINNTWCPSAYRYEDHYTRMVAICSEINWNLRVSRYTRTISFWIKLGKSFSDNFLCWYMYILRYIAYYRLTLLARAHLSLIHILYEYETLLFEGLLCRITGRRIRRDRISVASVLHVMRQMRRWRVPFEEFVPRTFTVHPLRRLKSRNLLKIFVSAKVLRIVLLFKENVSKMWKMRNNEVCCFWRRCKFSWIFIIYYRYSLDIFLHPRDLVYNGIYVYLNQATILEVNAQW